MKLRPVALGLALGLVFTLCACSPRDVPNSGGQQPPEESPAVTQSAAPSQTAAPSPEASTQAPETATPEPETAEPSSVPDKGTPAPTAQAPATQAPTAKPEPTPTAAPATPVPTPEPTPTPTPEPTLTAADVFTAVSNAIGGAPSGMEPGATVLMSCYGISADDLEDFYFRVPKTSDQVTEFFIAKVKSGKMDAVKEGCLIRQEDLAASAELYPENAALVEGYKLETQGDWVLFCVTENAAAAVEAFQNAVK